ncbi:hypothetical protein, partial [Lishizhenia sp.]|uniref:hypothetical protein n=1 Tax=Lishizhenia sp. TaxID=2497594 RepID=UPI00299D1046
MKKLLFSVGLISALSFQTNAQTNQVLDATFKVNEDPNFNFTSTLGEIDDAVFDYYYDGKSKFLAKYKNGKEVKSLELEKKTSKFKRNAFRGRDFFFLADDHIFEVVMNRDKDDKNYYIVSYDSNLKASRPTLLLTTTGKVRFTEGSENLIVIEETAYSTTGFEMNISKIDANLDLQLVEKVKIDKASGNNFNLNDLKVVDNQLAFIGVETNDDDELIRSEFFKYDLNTDQETRFDIDYKALNQNISDYRFNIIGNKLLIKGFMGEEPKKKFLGGVFTYN